MRGRNFQQTLKLLEEEEDRHVDGGNGPAPRTKKIVEIFNKLWIRLTAPRPANTKTATRRKTCLDWMVSHMTAPSPFSPSRLPICGQIATSGNGLKKARTNDASASFSVGLESKFQEQSPLSCLSACLPFRLSALGAASPPPGSAFCCWRTCLRAESRLGMKGCILVGGHGLSALGSR